MRSWWIYNSINKGNTGLVKTFKGQLARLQTADHSVNYAIDMIIFTARMQLWGSLCFPKILTPHCLREVVAESMLL